MKKYILLLLFVGGYTIATRANSPLLITWKTVHQAPLMNIEGTSNAILSKLNAALSLNEKQLPKILPLISNFLTQKVNILPLQQSNPAAYTTKFSSMKNGFSNRIKKVLTPEQFSQFAALIPPANDKTNILSHLFF
jgi:hypothetical protein